RALELVAGVDEERIGRARTQFGQLGGAACDAAKAFAGRGLLFAARAGEAVELLDVAVGVIGVQDGEGEAGVVLGADRQRSKDEQDCYNDAQSCETSLSVHFLLLLMM